MPAARAIARRRLADARVRNLAFAATFLLVAYVQPVGYRTSYPTLRDRLAFARAFGANKALRLFYGVPHDLATIGGYATWRVAGVMSVFAAAWGLLAAVRGLRVEEDAGRREVELAGAVTRRGAFGAVLASIAAGALLLFLATLAGLLAAGLPAAGSAYLALATTAVIPVFAGVGAVASELGQRSRVATGIGTAVIVVSLLLRVVADTSDRLGGLRWATPLGWVEELRPFSGARPWVLVLPVAAGAVLLVAAGAIDARRDVGTGLLHARDRGPGSMRLLSSPLAAAVRDNRATMAAWLAGVGFYAVIIGLLSTSFSDATVTNGVREQLRKLGGASITTPAGALSFYFLLFALAAVLFVCGEIVTARREEAHGRLETVLAQPVGRVSWLAGRLLLAAAGAVTIALTAALLSWAGAASQSANVPLVRLLEAGANCLPVAALFLGLAALVFALAPRLTAGVAYGLVSLAYLWQLIGSFAGAPRWARELTPFAHVALVPAQAFDAAGAIVMGLTGVSAALLALVAFRRRDLAVA